jgi:hypothetical protein
MMTIAKGLMKKKSTYASTPRPEHPICAMLWHVCTRQPHVFEYVLWTLWLLTLAFWAAIFVLVVHCGATHSRPQQSRCVLDVYLSCLKEQPRPGSSEKGNPGLALHAFSLDDLTEKALKLGFTESELAKQQQDRRGSPKDALVRLILGLSPGHRGAAAEEDDVEMAARGEQPPQRPNATLAAFEDDY